MSEKARAFLRIAYAVLFLIIGIAAYSNNYQILLFRVIPLNSIAFIIIALLLFAYAVVGIVRVTKQEEQEDDEERLLRDQARFLSQQQGSTEYSNAARTPLTATCAVTITHMRGVLGRANVIAVMINGSLAGGLRNKGSLRVNTTVAENEITLIRSDTKATVSFEFTARSNGTVILDVAIDPAGNMTLTRV